MPLPGGASTLRPLVAGLLACAAGKGCLTPTPGKLTLPRQPQSRVGSIAVVISKLCNFDLLGGLGERAGRPDASICLFVF
jgi:hypothetical protein